MLVQRLSTWSVSSTPPSPLPHFESVDVDYLLYSGRCEHRVGDTPESVATDTGDSRRILHPPSLSLFFPPSCFRHFSFLGVSIGFGMLGAPTYSLIHYPGGPTTNGHQFIPLCQILPRWTCKLLRKCDTLVQKSQNIIEIRNLKENDSESW